MSDLILRFLKALRPGGARGFVTAGLALCGLLLISGCSPAKMAKRWAPGYQWYSVRADFEVAGKPVSLGGIVECERSTPFFFPYMIGPNAIETGPKTFAAELETGGVLMISPPSACGRSKSSVEEAFPEGWYPLVYWIDDPDRPQRGEVYFSQTYYRQPDARVRLLGFEAKYIGTGPSLLLRPEGYRTRMGLWFEVPWLVNRQPPGLRGYVITIAEEDLWSPVPGLRKALSSYEDLSQITFRSEVRKNEVQKDALTEFLWPGLRGSLSQHSNYRDRSLRTPPQGCRRMAAELPLVCGGLQRSYGLEPDPEDLGTGFTTRRLRPGMAVLLPHEAGPEERYAYRFDLFGEPFAGTFWGSWAEDLDFYSPRTRKLFRVQEVRLGPPVQYDDSNGHNPFVLD